MPTTTTPTLGFHRFLAWTPTSAAMGLSLILFASTAPAGAQPSHSQSPPQLMARVVEVKPVSQNVSVPVQQCETVQVQAPPAPAPNIAGINAGTVIGGIVGGVLGHQVGGGRGKDIATGVGAVGGALAGTAIANNAQSGPVVGTTQNCRTVQRTESRVVGYDVAYEYAGEIYRSRLRNPPGEFVPVRVSVQALSN